MHMALVALFCGNSGSENWCKSDDTLATATVVNNKLSFVSDMGSSCFLPHSCNGGRLIG